MVQYEHTTINFMVAIKTSSRKGAEGALFALLELAARSAIIGGKIIFRNYKQMKLKNTPQSTYINRLKRFEKFGLIKKYTTANGNFYTLTARAKALRRQAAIKKLRNDGFSTLITFDIPEKKHKARDTFRRYLLKNGYTQIKESTFIAPFRVSPNLLSLIHVLELHKNISFFSVKPEYYNTQP